MTIEAIEIKWDLLGAKLAKLSNEEQVAFFKGFAHELSTYESQYLVEMQMFTVQDSINAETIKILKHALLCLWFKAEA